MAKCNWCGKEYDYFAWFNNYDPYCSQKCKSEAEASLAEKESSRQAAIAAEQRTAETRALRLEIEKQRLDAKAQAQGYIDYPDMLKKQFDNQCNNQIEKLTIESQNELNSTSDESADFILAKYFQKYIECSNSRVVYSKGIVEKDKSSLLAVLISIDGKDLYEFCGNKKIASFLFIKFNRLSILVDKDEWDSSNWFQTITLEAVYEYLYEKYCVTDSSNEIKNIFDGISNWYCQKKEADTQMKKTIRIWSTVLGGISGLLLGSLLINVNADTLETFLIGGLSLIGAILGGVTGGAGGAFGGLLILGFIGIGLNKALSIPSIGIPLFTLIFGAIGFGVSTTIIKKKELI